METIPLNARVECLDGACGETVTIVVNPTTHKVTHFVVRWDDLPHPDQRLVPMDQVLDTSSDLVRLGAGSTSGGRCASHRRQGGSGG